MTFSWGNKRYSLSAKLILLFAVMAVVFVMMVGGGIRHALKGDFKDKLHLHMVSYLDYVKADIGIPANRDRAQQLADRLKTEIQIFDARGSWSSSGRVTPLAALEFEPIKIAKDNRYRYAEDRRGRHYLVAREGDTTFLFKQSKKRRHEHGVRGWVPILILLALLLVLYHATRRLFSPVQMIKQGVEKFGAGDMEHRINVDRNDELGDLAVSFNAMAGDIQQMLEAKRQLLLAISHELRSPLTRTRVAAEMLEEGNNKAQIISDINEMETLIEELIETERLNSRHTKINKEPHNLAEVITHVVSTWHKDTDIVVTLPKEPVIFNVDSARIKLLLKNLIDNAVIHTAKNTSPPEILLQVSQQQVQITVRDYGSGIDQQHLEHLTEPFYRADASRQRETGGYGLGLYLCKMIVEAHSGVLNISSEISVGTTVTIQLPAT